ncbi:MAG TPA: carboxypeptidase regulatory-like domain-containing protein [Bryobacteraceae bacterium]|nr:carboxypeptidase regulatory-like domain-containing protein [Bryobacteraceae bacterium]
MSRFGWTLVILLACVASVRAQVTTQTIIGTVADRSGANVPGAKVTVTQIETNVSREATSDESGQYAVRLLPTGTYRVEIAAPNFKKFVQEGVTLEVSRAARVDATLEVGAVTESVSVTADAPLVNTTDATLGRTVENTEIVNLPLVNRDVYQLLNLTPGVESSEGGNAFGYTEQRTMINGGSYGGSGEVNYYLDGGNNTTGLRGTGNATPNPDAVQEFRVITNSYGAEFGRFAGGVIDVVTKSGSNEFHGSLFEFLRNDKLNAKPWLASTRPPLRRNQFGGTFGGPIVRDRTFFFGTYSGLRQRRQQFRNTAIVPTAAERRGDFSTSVRPPVDPLTRQPFPNGIIPIERFDPTARRILDQHIPIANTPGGFFEITQSEPLDTDEYQGKVDHHVGQSHQFTGSYYRTQGETTESLAGNLPWSQRQFKWTQQNFNAAHTMIVSPATINQFRLTYVRNFGGRTNIPELSLADFGSNYRIQGTPSLPQLNVSGYFNLSQAIAGPTAGSNFYGLREMLSITAGKHNLKIGADANLEKFIHDTTLNNYGVFSFDGTITGNALSDFMLGLPRTMNQDVPITKIDNSWYFGGFVQDDIRLTPHFTLNLGVRYDLQLPITDPLNRKSTFVAGRQSQLVPTAPLGLLFAGDPGVGRGIVPADRNNIAPRVAFAWDPFKTGRTSIRGGAGIFYGNISGNEWNTTADNQPFTVRQRFNDVRSLTDPYGNLPGGQAPFPYDFTPAAPRFISPASVSGPSLDFQWPYTYQFNFSVQRQVFSDLSVETAYVSSLGRHLPFTRDLNYPIFGAGATAANVDLRRPYLPGTLAMIGSLESSMTTSYHGLQISVDKRYSRSFLLKGYYTFSKSLEGARMQNDTTNGGAQNMNNLRAEKGRTDNDRRHNMVLSAVWQIGYFRNTPGLKYILNDWTVSSILTLRSGLPYTVSSGTDRNLDGMNNDRANLIGEPRLDPNRPRPEASARWFDPAAFVPAPLGQDGNSGRNILDGPGMRNIDLAVFRDFRIQESLRLQFRAEMTNAFNLVNLLNPNAALNSPAVGTIRNARGMRETQLGLRLTF